MILGAPRSGTTFLVDALSAASRTAAIAGRIHPSSMASIAANVDDPATLRALRHTLQFALTEHHRWVQQSRADAIGAFTARNATMSDVLAAFRRRRVVDHVVFKEPFLALNPTYVLDSLPAARIVHLHRDGRDVAASLVRSYDVLSDEHLASPDSNEVVIGTFDRGVWVPWWVPEAARPSFPEMAQMDRALLLWATMARNGHEAALAHPDQVLEIRYETLVADPVSTADRICEHLGLQRSRIMTTRLRRATTRSIGRGSAQRTTSVVVHDETAAVFEALGYDPLPRPGTR